MKKGERRRRVKKGLVGNAAEERAVFQERHGGIPCVWQTSGLRGIKHTSGLAISKSVDATSSFGCAAMHDSKVK